MVGGTSSARTLSSYVLVAWSRFGGSVASRWFCRVPVVLSRPGGSVAFRWFCRVSVVLSRSSRSVNQGAWLTARTTPMKRMTRGRHHEKVNGTTTRMTRRQPHVEDNYYQSTGNQPGCVAGGGMGGRAAEKSWKGRHSQMKEKNKRSKEQEPTAENNDEEDAWLTTSTTPVKRTTKMTTRGRPHEKVNGMTRRMTRRQPHVEDSYYQNTGNKPGCVAGGGIDGPAAEKS
ncbi:hypothetical protein Pcinc_042573 [Petrolisthes cinctipes]|uniref:Uncharacterized protein n=1 Tax=Petrolisthes cinctipes TaxID=88211 RepID=A0AAE1EIN8_PETCI|nr:hypothetical protein Pcinc_042573 [Petrolisthes cinctipes]